MKRTRISRKSYSTNYLEVSPSKKRPLRRRVVSFVYSNPTPSVNSCSSSTSTTTSSGITDARLAQASRYASPDLIADLTFHNFDGNPSVQGQSYSDRQQKAAEQWAEIRDQLQRVIVETRIPPADFKCVMCGDLAVVVCDDCSSMALFCKEHVEQAHLNHNIFH